MATFETRDLETKTKWGLHTNMCRKSFTFFIMTTLDIIIIIIIIDIIRHQYTWKQFRFHTLVTLILGWWIVMATLKFTQCICKCSSTGSPSVCLVLSHTLLPFTSQILKHDNKMPYDTCLYAFLSVSWSTEHVSEIWPPFFIHAVPGLSNDPPRHMEYRGRGDGDDREDKPIRSYRKQPLLC